MTGDWLNISKIETYLYSLFDKIVSNQTFVGGTLPNTLSKDWQDMILIDCGTGIRDLIGYGTGNINVILYTKPKANGAKNVKRMSEMEATLLEQIKSSRHEHYVISRNRTYTDYDATHDLHLNVVEINLTVK